MYPVLKKPILIEAHLKGEHPFLDMDISVPKKPVFQIGHYDWLIAGVVFGVLCFVIIFYHVFVGLFFGILTFLCTGTFFQYLKEDKSDHAFQLRRYEAQKFDFEKFTQKRSEIAELKKDASKYLAFLKEEIKSLAKETTEVETGTYSYTVGKSENLLWSEAKKIFGENIYRNITISNQSWIIPYMPDLVFNDGEILIDIEIDEPYSFKDSKPIHYYDLITKKHVDTDRDDYFLSNNWFVIRFTEKQVITHTKGCLLFIAEIINQISGNSQYLNHLCNVAPLAKEDFWTVEQVRLWVNESYRNSYSEIYTL